MQGFIQVEGKERGEWFLCRVSYRWKGRRGGSGFYAGFHTGGRKERGSGFYAKCVVLREIWG